MLNTEEEKMYNAIKKVEEGLMTRKEASYELGLTLRHVDRLRNVLRIQGKNGFIHKNRGKSNPNKINKSKIKELEDLYLSEYYDYNFEQFYDELCENKKYKDKYDISYSSLYRQFLKDDIISPLAHRETIRLYNERINKSIQGEENIQEEIIELFKSRQITFEQAHTRRSNNMYVFGQEVQMDACEKYWFGGIVTYLHLAVDKGTKKVLFGWFEYEELTRTYCTLLYNIIINYGIPEKIKTDNRNSFSNQNSNTESTQFGIICNMLKINLVTTSVSTAKANVERENKTFKDRLIAELRHENINDINEANKYLNDIFIPKMNRKFSYQIDSKTSRMRPNNYTERELNLIISEKHNRIIDNASSIKYDCKYFIPINPNTGEVTCFMKKTQCIFIITYNGEYWCQIENEYYQMKELESRDTIMKKEEKSDEPRERKKYIPPSNHPWRTYKN